MPTEVLTPIGDGAMRWPSYPNTTSSYDHVDEGHATPDYSDYIYNTVNAEVGKLVMSVPTARDIDQVSSVRIYYPSWGLLGTSSGVALKLDVYGGGVLKGTNTLDADTGATQVLAYADIPVSGMGQAEADAMEVWCTILVDPAGGPYPEPDLYVVP